MKLVETERLQQVLNDFIRARDWARYHSPKNLSMALSVEVAELVEIFQWKTEQQSLTVMATDEREHVRQELADILIYLVELASVLEVDLDAAVRDKIALNAAKYPAITPSQVNR
ncbi:MULTISPECIES: nucleotide pyrophosphohydrolase [Cupriavidus]|uniref:nucleotide pyrophosphohydrolase n=1 Tax=Cupriavidus TaxID=106589 RepID=UPI000290ECAC|nr:MULTISPECIES: nucleotide pyrophosphohydrolase [Cupriavidus]ESJ21839.1 nucleotide pyrophosphohydrolase [Cupriavidus sp. HPC(L)]MCD9123242.1 nucleotide pyrophosphohydrolase [Cupriavidus sp. UGS-1]